MTTTQISAITSPPESLLVYDTTLRVFKYYRNSAWVSLGSYVEGNFDVNGDLDVSGLGIFGSSLSALSLAITNAITAASATLTGAFQALTGTFTSNLTVGGVTYLDDDTTPNTPVISFTGDTNTGIGRSAADTLDLITNGNSRFRIESTGQIKAVYESSLGTDYNATLHNGYLCRAWVNFNGTASQKTGTYSRTGTTITVTITSHGLNTGDQVGLDFTTGTATDGIYIATVTNANVYTVTDIATGSTSGNVTQDAMIRASGNVSSIVDNTTGDYTVNFTTAMPDASYSALVNSNTTSAGNYVFNTTIKGGTLPTSSAITINTYNTAAGSLVDVNFICLGIFR
jgi:hypothetical protein